MPTCQRASAFKCCHETCSRTSKSHVLHEHPKSQANLDALQTRIVDASHTLHTPHTSSYAAYACHRCRRSNHNRHCRLGRGFAFVSSPIRHALAMLISHNAVPTSYPSYPSSLTRLPRGFSTSCTGSRNSLGPLILRRSSFDRLSRRRSLNRCVRSIGNELPPPPTFPNGPSAWWLPLSGGYRLLVVVAGCRVSSVVGVIHLDSPLFR